MDPPTVPLPHFESLKKKEKDGQTLGESRSVKSIQPSAVGSKTLIVRIDMG